MMNSLAPLTSLSKTIHHIFYQNGQAVNPSELNELHISTTLQGLKAIEEQSAGILDFVTSYRKLTKIPTPVIREIDVVDWIDQIKILYQQTCSAKSIHFEIKRDEAVKEFMGDKNLLNQVLINIINNAIDALEDVERGKRLLIIFSKNLSNCLIHIGNNGPVIPKEFLDKIFVPFFTTKEKGSGIGLNVSSQIIKLHKGTLDVFSKNEETIFTISI